MFMTKDATDYTLREVPKDRLTNTYLQKTFNERRRKYRERIMAVTRSPSNSLSLTKRSQARVPQEGTKIDMSDAVVVRYTNGQEDLIT